MLSWFTGVDFLSLVGGEGAPVSYDQPAGTSGPHHVQTLTGIESQVREGQACDPQSRNELSVRMELQADGFAGVRGHVASQPGRAVQGKVALNPGDVEEALRAASAIGDDTIQRRSGGASFPTASRTDRRISA